VNNISIEYDNFGFNLFLSVQLLSRLLIYTCSLFVLVKLVD